MSQAPIRCGLSPVLHGGFPNGDRPGLLRALATVADQGGFDMFWVEDHTRLPAEEISASEGISDFDEPLDAWTTLAYLAGITERVRLGTEVTPVTLRHPSMLAMSLATLDVLSGGRVVFGAGTGWHKKEFTSLGIPFEKKDERYAKSIEALEVMQALWTQPVANFDGHVLSAHRCRPRAQAGATGWHPHLVRRLLRSVARSDRALRLRLDSGNQSRSSLHRRTA